MAKSSRRARVGENVSTHSDARTIAIARRGIRSGEQFAEMMSALMSDLIEGKITPQIANATCNAGGKLLKIVELQFKYGQPHPQNKGRRVLPLTVVG